MIMFRKRVRSSGCGPAKLTRQAGRTSLVWRTLRSLRAPATCELLRENLDGAPYPDPGLPALRLGTAFCLT